MTALLALALASSPDYATEIAAALEDTAGVFPVPASLVRAVIRAESGFQPRAVSSAGAIGLMQVMPDNAARLGVTEGQLYEPRTNILAGVRLLAALLKHYDGDVISALVAYNSGPKRKELVPDNGETPAYVLAILRYWREYDSTPSASNEVRAR